MERKIVIIYGSTAPIPPIRGIAPGIVIYNTVEHMKKKNVVVFSNWESGLEKFDYNRNKYIAVKIDVLSKIIQGLISLLPYRLTKSFLKNFFFTTDKTKIRYYLAVGLKVRSYQPDIIVIHVSYGLVFLIHLLCPYAKIIYYHHGSNMHEKLSKENWERLQKASNAGIISVSNAAFTELNKKFGVSPTPKWVIHNGVNSELFNKVTTSQLRMKSRLNYNLSEVDFVYGYTGRIYRSKGLWQLLLAFEQVHMKHPNTRLYIAGSSDQENTPDKYFEIELKKQASNLGKAVEFFGFIPNNEIPRFISMIDLGVLPSITYEGIPLTLLEFMACGVPVIATNIGGISEIINHEKTGVLLNLNNLEQELIHAMTRFYNDRTFGKICGDNAASIVKQKYTYQHVAQKFEKILDHVAST